MPARVVVVAHIAWHQQRPQIGRAPFAERSVRKIHVPSGTVAGIDQRHGLHGNVLNLLRDAVFGKVEVFGLQIAHDGSVAVKGLVRIRQSQFEKHGCIGQPAIALFRR